MVRQRIANGRLPFFALPFAKECKLKKMTILMRRLSLLKIGD
jgi:hypothetical protein